jgi:hypothetical protein
MNLQGFRTGRRLLKPEQELPTVEKKLCIMGQFKQINL